MTSFIGNTETVKKYRATENAFTRKRKLTFELLVLFILNMPKRNLSLELHNFLNLMHKRCKLSFNRVTPGAFTQSREKLRPEVFLGLNQVLLDEYYTDNNERVTLWKGFRLLAIDGSKVTLPYTKELHAIYGNIKNLQM